MQSSSGGKSEVGSQSNTSSSLSELELKTLPITHLTLTEIPSPPLKFDDSVKYDGKSAAHGVDANSKNIFS